MFPEARLAYVTPSNQYPLGVTLSLNRRLELLEWAAASGAWIIEDDFNSEYRYVSRPLSSLQGLSNQEQVIYVGTFSKVLFPSVRVGYMVVPSNLVERFSIVREATDIFPPTLPQMVLSEFIAEGHFARHVRKMRAIYCERLDELKSCVEQEMSGKAFIETAESGMHTVLFTKAEIDDVAFSREAARRGITAMPLSPCYLGNRKRYGLILGFAGTGADQIRKGVKILSETLSNFDSAE
jgi:GntR family transcriptional regulator/MocR family aminotransferase